MRPARTRPDAIAARQRAVQVVKLRTAGASFDQIAQQLGYANRSGPYKALQRVLHSSEHEAAEELRRVGLIRLEALLKQLWPIATDPDSNGQFRAINTCLDIQAQINKLCGLT